MTAEKSLRFGLLVYSSSLVCDRQVAREPRLRTFGANLRDEVSPGGEEGFHAGGEFESPPHDPRG